MDRTSELTFIHRQIVPRDNRRPKPSHAFTKVGMMNSLQHAVIPDGNERPGVPPARKTLFTPLPSEVLFEMIDAIFKCNRPLSWKDILAFVTSTPEIQLVFREYRTMFLRRHLSGTPKNLGSPSDFVARYTDGRDTSQYSEDHGRWFWNVCKPLSQVYTLLDLPGDIKTRLGLEDWHCSPRNKDEFVALFSTTPTWDAKALIDYDHHAALWRKRPIPSRKTIDAIPFLRRLTLPELEALEDVWHWLGFFYFRLIVAEGLYYLARGQDRIFAGLGATNLYRVIHWLCERGLELLCRVIGASPKGRREALRDAINMAHEMKYDQGNTHNLNFVLSEGIWSEMFHRMRFTAGADAEEEWKKHKRYLELWHQQWRATYETGEQSLHLNVAQAQRLLVSHGVNAALLSEAERSAFQLNPAAAGRQRSIATYASYNAIAGEES
ncbi:hypothetical protein CGCF415_v010396 [Colletotrichum fructicola]|uniref:Uncharacterized protein n=2 Tax=Colletotrichum fructicola (strain Nara gc5) TaxID=1213859 RepID=L2G124_COLFN|nr:hypothetical protein CGCFRS4_v011048 [Colletotrichum fructicola]KAF4899772.1 hypothetical protein CGCF415_v010396 [Colletotrichum fructicola]KAF4932490.1 hypothetical protein CGCF245_v010576 [Colletotrichum fructicola]KAF5483444.1 hypothetical protein CGCF413_v014414 [Colletotrichum fructicola]